MNGRVSVQVESHVAHVRMIRTDRINALDADMFDALIDAGRQVAGDRDVRAVVLSGDGKGFCSGIDTGGMSGKDRASRRPIDIVTRNCEGMNIPQFAVLQWQLLAVPVIAAIHDVALGGGLQLALGADMRFVAPTARLSMMEVKWGLVPDMGGTALLPGLVARDKAFDLVMSGRTISGDEALALGLATRVCDDPVAEALAEAKQIASHSPDAVRAAKRLLLTRLTDPDDMLALESAEAIALLGSPNQKEAVRARVAGEVPEFVPPLEAAAG